MVVRINNVYRQSSRKANHISIDLRNLIGANE
jgi:hypothetical protein